MSTARSLSRSAAIAIAIRGGSSPSSSSASSTNALNSAAAEHALGAAEFNAFVEDALDDEGLEPPRIAIAIAALRDKLRAVL
ncbi:MAG TPA: hypothetical protein VL242_09165, partial [Sorangium sp.]|nr:hypothetical protein [Sorangium sp.]